ncbi:hypothetical protein KC19_8G200100 [Ceratodon purpureus]|uniref:BSD2 cysteine rich domain-containing protein n=1 Tax=Ceratodon purpureus TaxID=3225 RepID=A0A8T0H595_CERPU|nr:hypothetical protein KC19_8G200100 [Ceratodon purpureus]
MACLQAAAAAQLGFRASLSSSSSSFQAAAAAAAVETTTTPTVRRPHGPLQYQLCAVRSGLRFVSKGTDGKRVVRVNSSSGSGPGGDSGAAAPPAAKKASSILCQSCDGNGAVACSQCHGAGVNSEDHFNGRFKTGQTCWLCRGKRQMLCGSCNGAGFMGGFMNTQDE